MQTNRLILVLLFACFAATGVHVATAQVATASVAGTVVGDPSDEPIADATVTLYAPMLPGGKSSTQTDGAGAFSFKDLVGGGYRIGVSKQGFVPVQEGQRHYRSAGRLFALGDGERRDVRLRLPRLGVITGRIVDERGQSAGQRVGARAGRSRCRPAIAGSCRRPKRGPTTAACTDCTRSGPTATWSVRRRAARLRSTKRNTSSSRSTGHARVPRTRSGPGAAAAHERVAALEARLPARIDPVRGYAPACHATATGARATITIGPGDERAGVDLRLADTRLARIEGTVTGLALGPDQDAGITLLNQDEALGDVPEAMRVAGEGRFGFRFWHIPPGRYAMVLTERSSSRNPSPMRWLAAAPLVVANEDLTGVVLEVPKSATVRGEVVLRGEGSGSCAGGPRRGPARAGTP